MYTNSLNGLPYFHLINDMNICPSLMSCKEYLSLINTIMRK